MHRKLTKLLMAVCIGVVLAAEKKEVSSLFVPTRESGKLYKMGKIILLNDRNVESSASTELCFGC